MLHALLKPTKQRLNRRKIFGFDIETYDDNRKFYCGSIYDIDNIHSKTFLNKDDLINYLKKTYFYRSFVSATNLSFDFFGTFYKHDDVKKFRMLWRGSDLLFAKSYFKGGDFTPVTNKHSITFIDTLNFGRVSVEKLGKILKLPKLEKPDFLGQKPKTIDEKEQLITYNMRDAEISAKGMQFFFKSFEKLGATPKNTISSTSMSLFKNKYLNNCYFRHPIRVLKDQFKGYYGGRTEAFARGEIKNYNYYDFNSLYPDVMRNEFPDPNSLRENCKNSIFYIENFEGVSYVDIYVPEMEFPPLPFRYDSKLYFPVGNIRGWFSNLELRYAMELGCTIKQVFHSYYYKNKCIPFKQFVEDLYVLRLEYKKEKSPMEYIVKIVMNSLYGKFGQKFENRDNWVPFNHTLEQLQKLDYFERHGEFIRIVKRYSHPPAFTVPIWALYVTSYARIKLHRFIRNSQPVYVDTDSLITKKEFHSGKGLGDLKLEMFIKRGIIVKPKFYALEPYNKPDYVKIKGVGTRVSLPMFFDLLQNPSITYDKFMRFKESIRRGFIPNEIQEITKNLSIEDEKRKWGRKFIMNEFQSSKPFNTDEIIQKTFPSNKIPRSCKIKTC